MLVIKNLAILKVTSKYYVEYILCVLKIIL